MSQIFDEINLPLSLPNPQDWDVDLHRVNEIRHSISFPIETSFQEEEETSQNDEIDQSNSRASFDLSLTHGHISNNDNILNN